METISPFVNDVTCAKALNVSPSFLRKDRRTAKRVPFIRLGDRCLYDVGRAREALLALEEGGQSAPARKRQRKPQPDQPCVAKANELAAPAGRSSA